MSYTKPENPKCPDCNGPMKSRQNKQSGQYFWGCIKFPDCKGTRDTDGLSKEDKRKKEIDYEDDLRPD